MSQLVFSKCQIHNEYSSGGQWRNEPLTNARTVRQRIELPSCTALYMLGEVGVAKMKGRAILSNPSLKTSHLFVLSHFKDKN